MITEKGTPEGKVSDIVAVVSGEVVGTVVDVVDAGGASVTKKPNS